MRMKQNLFKSITNDIAPFVSITWHQKEPLGCVVYSHCPTNDSTTYVYIAAAYLAIMLLSLLSYCRG